MKSEVFRRIPKSSENVRSLSPSINANSLPVLFTSKIRDREKGIVFYSFYTWFSFLTWVWVDIFLDIVSSKTETTHILQSGVRNWPAGVSRREIEVFNRQAWDSRLRRESWQVYVHSWWLFLLTLSRIKEPKNQLEYLNYLKPTLPYNNYKSLPLTMCDELNWGCRTNFLWFFSLKSKTLRTILTGNITSLFPYLDYLLYLPYFTGTNSGEEGVFSLTLTSPILTAPSV